MDVKNLKEALDFIDRIRAAPSSTSTNLLKAFLQAFSNYQKRIWGLDELDRQISSIFENHHDLLREYRTFRNDFDSSSRIQYVPPPENDNRTPWDSYYAEVLKRCTTSDQRAEVLKPLFDYLKTGRLGFLSSVDNFLWKNPAVLTEGFPGFPPLKPEAKKGERNQRKKSPDFELGPEKFRKMIRCSRSFQYSPESENRDSLAAVAATPLQKSGSENSEKKKEQKIESPDAELELGSKTIRKRIRCSPTKAQVSAEISSSAAAIAATTPPENLNFRNPGLESREFDKTERCTPSYLYIRDAETLETRKGKKKTMIGFDPGEVLNSTLQCKKLRDYDAKPRKKSSHELMMEDVEDKLFKLDMGLSRTRHAARALEKLMEENPGGDVRKHLNGMDLRCISLLYANVEEKVVQRYYAKSEEGIPIFLKELRRKEKELLEFKRNFKITR